jgi:hypothetical protein
MKMKLKYLFNVEFTDGTTLKQTKQDVSKIDPKRSAFFDVLNSGKEIRSFTLGKLFDRWSVDLKTGVFSHNGYKFQLEENLSPVKRTLEFFRQHQHDMSLEGKETDHRVTYFLGYSVGKKKYLIGIK